MSDTSPWSIRLLFQGHLWIEENRRALEEISGETILWACEGSRYFRPPADIGIFSYEGCHFFQFEESPSLSKGLQEALNESSFQRIEIEGVEVFVAEEKVERETWSFYFTRPRPSLLIVSTSQVFLMEVLHRMRNSPTDAAFPASIPEWNVVDTSSIVWAIRHYRWKDADLDPSSPYSSHPIIVTQRDPSAVGMTFYIDSSGKRGVVSYLSSSPAALSIAREQWRLAENPPQYRELKPGVIQVSFDLGAPQSPFMFYLTLMGTLGHAVFI